MDLEFHLYPEPWGRGSESRLRGALLASVMVHVAGVVAVAVVGEMLPAMPGASRKAEPRHITLTYPPPPELTQKAPNKAPPSKMFVGAPELPRPPLLLPPRPKPSSAPLTRLEPPPQLVDKPDPAGNQLTQILPPPAAPQTPVSSPKLVLEEAHRRPGGRSGDPQAGVLAPQAAGKVIEGAVRELSRNPGAGGMVVGDGFSSGIPGGSTSPTLANVGSNLELLSDPLGVDFKPYLTRILAAVRRNWYAVIPESARLGIVRGRTAIQFIIVRQGGVSKLVIAGASGVEALDRAAVAGISASNPFPPLPPEFRGDHVRLQFMFLYNIPVR